MCSICWLDSYLLLNKWCWCYCYCCCRCCLCCQLCLCDDDYEIIHQSGPAQPRSPCELPPADHPHRPGSHQQSCCPLSNFQKLNFVTHIAQISYLKNMRSPSKTQPITMKELDRTRNRRAESSPKTKRSERAWRAQRARRAQRALSTECLCP